MKKAITTAFVLIICLQSFAAFKRLGYWGNPVAGVDYTDATSAVAACATGDSIYVYGNNEGSPWAISLDKQITIIGSGYLYADNTPTGTAINANMQNYTPFTQAYVYLQNGSSGSVITGITGTVTCHASSNANINNIRISRCYIQTIIGFVSGITYDNWQVDKCYIVSAFGNSQGKLTNLRLFNNLFVGGSNISIGTATAQSGIIENCTFWGSTPNLGGQAFLVQNSISNSSFTNTQNTVFNHCLFTVSPSPAPIGANNQVNVAVNDLFGGVPTQGSFSDDGKFALKAGSPALAAGVSGVDCGAFGGADPYKLSGIPNVPAIYKLSAPSNAASTNPYTITISTRGNN